jgi:hypothetical protein
MISIVFIGVATALMAFAIMAKVGSGEPKRAKKAEKAEIVKQLLALSEQENSTSRTASSVRFRALPSGQGVRPSNAPRTTAAKTSRLSVQEK